MVEAHIDSTSCCISACMQGPTKNAALESGGAVVEVDVEDFVVQEEPEHVAHLPILFVVLELLFGAGTFQRHRSSFDVMFSLVLTLSFS